MPINKKHLESAYFKLNQEFLEVNPTNTTIDIDISEKALKIIDLYSSKYNVSRDAVVSALLRVRIEEEASKETKKGSLKWI